MPWTVYILECADKTFYTGITNDLERRIARHGTGQGARYTRGRGPFRLVYKEIHKTKSRALRREAEIKSLKKGQKLKLVAAPDLKLSD